MTIRLCTAIAYVGIAGLGRASDAPPLAPRDLGGPAWEYHFQGSNSYVVAFATQVRAYLELRSYGGKVLQSIDLYSPHSEPSVEAKDVVGDEALEFLLRTNGGGTGLDETDLRIFSLVKGRLHEIGTFVLDESDFGFPDESEELAIHGTVEYPRKNEIRYRRIEILTKNGTTTTNATVDTYVFDPVKAKLRKKTEAPTTAPTLPSRKRAGK